MTQTKTKNRKLKYDPKKCLGCRTCEVVCAIGHSQGKELLIAIKEESVSVPRVRVFPYRLKEMQNFPIACRHCDDPRCVEACIAKALTKNIETGIVDYDKDRCVGCWMCVMACPYGAIRPNPKTKKTVRCDLCEGEDSPRCANACPVKAIILEQE